MKFPIKDFFTKCDLVTITEEILNKKTSFFVQRLYLLGKERIVQ